MLEANPQTPRTGLRSEWAEPLSWCLGARLDSLSALAKDRQPRRPERPRRAWYTQAVSQPCPNSTSLGLRP